jgi:hypothetical protein
LVETTSGSIMRVTQRTVGGVRGCRTIPVPSAVLTAGVGIRI